MEELNNSLVV